MDVFGLSSSRTTLIGNGGEYKNDGAPENSDDEDDRVKTKTRKVLQLSSLKVYAPAEGFSILKEIYLTRSGATDNDIEKIAKMCQGITTLDCSGCPRIGDIGMSFLVPKLIKTKRSKGGFNTELVGCSALKKLYLHGTSVTNVGIRGILASKLISTLKVVGVSTHISPDIIAEMKSRRIECPGTFDPKDKDNNSSLAIFTGIGDTIDTLMEPLPKMWDDIAELLKFSACWPSDN